MNRRTVFYLAVMVVVVLFMSFLATALMPIWLPVILVKPSITSPIQQRIMQGITRQMIKGMMSGGPVGVRLLAYLPDNR